MLLLSHYAEQQAGHDVVAENIIFPFPENWFFFPLVNL